MLDTDALSAPTVHVTLAMDGVRATLHLSQIMCSLSSPFKGPSRLGFFREFVTLWRHCSLRGTKAKVHKKPKPVSVICLEKSELDDPQSLRRWGAAGCEAHHGVAELFVGK